MNEVENLLEQKSIQFKRAGKDYLVHCLNPEHDDTHPSLRIDSEEGVFHCLSCGFRGNIFSLFNKHRNVFNSKVNKIRKKLQEIKKASWTGFELPHDAFFVPTAFGNIPVEEYKAFETNLIGMEGRTVFPILDANNRIVAFQGRYKHTDAPPKYLNYPKEVTLPWMPNQFLIEGNYLVLVEGLRDMVVLRNKGINNAVCIFGTKSVNYDNILEYLTPYMLKGVDTIYLLMDGDKAGRDATKHLRNCIERKTDLICEEIDLPDGVDPASMDDDQIRFLKKLLA